MPVWGMGQMKHSLIGCSSQAEWYGVHGHGHPEHFEPPTWSD